MFIRTNKPSHDLARRWGLRLEIENWPTETYRRAERKLRAIEKLILADDNAPMSEVLDWEEERLLKSGLSPAERLFVVDCLKDRSLTANKRLREILDLLPRRMKTNDKEVKR